MLLALVAGGVKGLDLTLRKAALPHSAAQFLRYFERLDGAADQNWWERLAVSLLLSRNDTAARAALDAVPAGPLYFLVGGRRVGGGGQP